MTKEQFEALQPYEKHLMLAYKSNQLVALSSRDVIKIAAVAEQFGFYLDNKNCAHCVLSICKGMGKLYDDYLTEMKSSVEVTEETNTTNTSTQDNGTKKNRKRKVVQSE